MSKGVFKYNNPGELKATLTLTMTVDAWKLAIESDAGSWNRNQIDNVVRELVQEAGKHFYAEHEAEAH